MSIISPSTKIPRSFVFSRGKLPGSLRQLQADLRKLMFPYTAPNLKIVLSGFGTGEQHLKLTTIMFQNIFPAIDVKLSSCQRIVLLNYNKERKLIDFQHYSIRLQPVPDLRKLVQNHQVPDLRSLQDVSDFVTKLIHSTKLCPNYLGLSHANPVFFIQLDQGPQFQLNH
ncbi:hypothetical protein ACSBR2_021404 [Camellia fascicularis]